MGKRGQQRRPHDTAARRPARMAALLLALAVALAGCSGTGSDSLQHSAAAGAPSPATTSAAVSPTLPAPTTTVVPTTRPATPTTVTPTTTVPKATTPPATASLAGPGQTVLQLQQRLTELGYWLGTPDGKYGLTTSQAVMALQKVAGVGRDGVFGATTAAALAAGVKLTPQSQSGRVIEVDLAHQVVLIVTNGHLDAVLNTSTGGGYRFSINGRSSVAITPTGHFTTYRQIDGRDVSPLGVLWRPKYFVGGIALHGATDVPGHPASHGCVRVSNAAINWIWATNIDPIGTAVWVY